jgi:hypothetical protein
MTALVKDPNRVHVTYHFEFSNGEKRSFEVDEDLTDTVVKHYSENRYPWAELGFKKCDNCPLASDDTKYCPAIVSLVDIIEYFSEHQSYATCDCRVEFPNKTVSVENRPLQSALFPLMGLRMATSQCPILRQLKFMARFHEPFATPLYTVYRATSGYLLGRFFENQKTAGEDWSLAGLRKIYLDVQQVNQQLAERLTAAKVMDATPNSIVILSMFGVSITSLLDEYLDVLRNLYG